MPYFNTYGNLVFAPENSRVDKTCPDANLAKVYNLTTESFLSDLQNYSHELPNMTIGT